MVEDTDEGKNVAVGGSFPSPNSKSKHCDRCGKIIWFTDEYEGDWTFLCKSCFIKLMEESDKAVLHPKFRELVEKAGLNPEEIKEEIIRAAKGSTGVGG